VADEEEAKKKAEVGGGKGKRKSTREGRRAGNNGIP